MLFTIVPDLATLYLSSALSRACFLLIFLVMLIGSSKVRYLRHWTSALVTSTISLFILATYAGSTKLPLLISFFCYTTLLGSLALCWTGLRLFYKRSVGLGFLLLPTFVPSIFYVTGAILDFSEQVLLPIIYLSGATVAGLAFFEIAKVSGERLITSYLVATAFAIYFFALALPGVLIFAGVLPAATNASSLPAMIFDQASSIFVYFGYIAMKGEQATLELRHQASTDPLTQVGNRRDGQFSLERLYRNSRRGNGCSVILADIDHFKAVNDTWGHNAGDLVLIGVAERLAGSLRDGDRLLRWGGEEFLIILPNTCISQAKTSANRLRELIAGSPFSIGKIDLPITLSLGCAEMGINDDGYQDSLQRADEALYHAKAAGRNQVG